MQQKHNKALRMLMPIKSLWHSDWMKFEMADIPSRPALISVLSGVQRCIFQWEMNNDAVELLFSTFFPSTGWNSTCCVLEKIRPVQTVETWCNATDCEPFPSSVVLHSIKRRLHQRKCQWKKIIRAKRWRSCFNANSLSAILSIVTFLIKLPTQCVSGP